MESDRFEPVMWKGAAAGIAAGLAASWAMNAFQSAWSKLSQQNKQHGEQQESDEDATMKAADRVARTVLGRGLSMDEKKKAGPIMHYVFGSSMGAFYGMTAERAHLVTAGEGTAFGTALFLGADEAAMTAFGLSGPPQSIPLSKHAYAWVSHLVYGATLEQIRKIIRYALGRAVPRSRTATVSKRRERAARMRAA